LVFITPSKQVARSKPVTLILASQSPRRKKILKFLDIPFRVVKPKRVDESPFLREPALKLVKRLSLNKALAVSKQYPHFPVLAADTVVVQNGKIYGKPKDLREAFQMISSLQGTKHEVWTGTALVWKKRRIQKNHAQKTTVSFRKLSFREIEKYVQTNEPYDKAGAYDIQESASKWIKKWEGDYFNVMGLPIQWVVQQMEKISRLEKS
jgi:septum formation protein